MSITLYWWHFLFTLVWNKSRCENKPVKDENLSSSVLFNIFFSDWEDNCFLIMEKCQFNWRRKPAEIWQILLTKSPKNKITHYTKILNLKTDSGRVWLQLRPNKGDFNLALPIWSGGAASSSAGQSGWHRGRLRSLIYKALKTWKLSTLSVYSVVVKHWKRFRGNY